MKETNNVQQEVFVIHFDMYRNLTAETIISMYENKIRFSALSYVKNHDAAEIITDRVIEAIRAAETKHEQFEDLDLFVAKKVREFSLQYMIDQIIWNEEKIANKTHS